jgi:hypothetical protein
VGGEKQNPLHAQASKLAGPVSGRQLKGNMRSAAMRKMCGSDGPLEVSLGWSGEVLRVRTTALLPLFNCMGGVKRVSVEMRRQNMGNANARCRGITAPLSAGTKRHPFRNPSCRCRPALNE